MPPYPALVLLLAVGHSAAAFRLNILHTNDMHARFEETSASGGPCGRPGTCYGGFARVKAEADRLKALSPEDTLFLNAGDTYQGTPYYYIFKWRVVKALVDMLGIDVMSLGNHEFDDGVEGLEPYLREVRTPNVAANLDLSRAPGLASPRLNLRPSHSLLVKGVNITVIGYITPDTKFLARPGEVGFRDEVEVLRPLAKAAKAEGAKLVIALGHSGFPMDKKIAAEVEDVDVVVGGHTNTFLYTGTPPDLEVPESTYPHMVKQASGKEVPVVQAGCYTKYLGHLVLDFDDDFKLVSATGNPVLLNANVSQDALVQAEIMTWKNNMSAQLNETVGRIVVDLDASNCRNGECNIGNFFTDAIVDYHVRETEGQLYKTGWTNAPIGVINSGAIRTSLNLNETKGSITEGDLLTAVPFDNKMVRLTVNGSVVKEMLEQSIKKYDLARNRGKGGFLQLSGLRVTYDLDLPEGERVVSVEARCGECLVPAFHPLNHSAHYSIIISEYMVQGGDGYELFAGIPLEQQEKLEWREVEAFRSFATKGTPLYPGLEGRIRMVRGGGKSSGVPPAQPLSILIILLAALLHTR